MLIFANVGLVVGGASIISEQAMRLAIGAQPLSEELVVLELGLSAVLPAAFEGAPPLVRSIRRLPWSARVDEAVAASKAEPIFRVGSDAEPYGVSVIDEALANEGKVMLPTKHSGNKGLDVAAKGFDESSIDLFEIKTIGNYEEGDLQAVVARLKDTKTLGRQMSERYVSAQGVVLIGKSEPALQSTGFSILKATERTRHIVVIDQYGNMFKIDPQLVDLAFETMPNEWLRPFSARGAGKSQ